MAVAKQSDKLRSDNTALKKQISIIEKMDRMQMDRNRGKYIGSDASVGKYNKVNRRGKEEDIISLNLSQWSNQQI